MTSIGTQAFWDCDGLTALTLPESLISIGYKAFASCNQLSQIRIHHNVTSIGYGAFEDCTALQSIYCLHTEEQLQNICEGQISGTFSSARVYTLTRHEGTPATCVEDGLADWYTFEDSDDDSLYVNWRPVAEIPLVPAGHDWGEPTYVWAADGSTVTAERTCRRDASHVETETAAVHYWEDTAAACEEPGWRRFTSDDFINPAFTAQNWSIQIQAPLGHQVAVDPAVLPTAHGTGLTEGAHCAACGKVLIAQETVPALNSDENPRIVLVNAATEGSDLVFDVVYDGHDPVVLPVYVIQNGEKVQIGRSVDLYRVTIPAIELLRFEAGPISLTVHIFDNTSSTSMDLCTATTYARPNALTTMPRLLSNENGQAVIYCPDADQFITDSGLLYTAEGGILHLSSGDDGKYAAIVNGKRTSWLDVTVAERADLLVMEPVELIMEKSYRRGLPITLTVTGDPDAVYTWYMEQPGAQMAEGILPGPGTYTLDLGCLQISDPNGSTWDYRVDFYLYVYKEGYQDISVDRSFSIVSNTVPTAPSVTVLTPEPWYINQPIRFRIEKEGATEYCALFERNGATWVVPAAQECEFTFGNDEYTGLTIQFSAKVDGVWSEYSDSMFIDAAATGELEAPKVQAPALGLTGSTVQVQWDTVDGADRYDVYAYYDRSMAYFSQTVTQTSVSIPVNCNANDVMHLYVTAKGPGCRDAASESCTVLIRKAAGGTLNLPKALKTIEHEAFAGDSFSIVIIPNGCREIGPRAFSAMPNLLKVRIPASVTTIADDAFDGSGICLIETTPGSTAEAFAIGHQIPVINEP